MQDYFLEDEFNMLVPSIYTHEYIMNYLCTVPYVCIRCSRHPNFMISFLQNGEKPNYYSKSALDWLLFLN